MTAKIIAGCIIVAILIFGYFIIVVWGKNLWKFRKSKDAPVETLNATVAKIYYENGFGSSPEIRFQVEGEKRPRKFLSRIPEIAHFPDPGTPGILTCKGGILYSFRWEGGEVIQDEPGSDSKQTYGNIV